MEVVFIYIYLKMQKSHDLLRTWKDDLRNPLIFFLINLIIDINLFSLYSEIWRASKRLSDLMLSTWNRICYSSGGNCTTAVMLRGNMSMYSGWGVLIALIINFNVFWIHELEKKNRKFGFSYNNMLLYIREKCKISKSGFFKNYNFLQNFESF